MITTSTLSSVSKIYDTTGGLDYVSTTLSEPVDRLTSDGTNGDIGRTSSTSEILTTKSLQDRGNITEVSTAVDDKWGKTSLLMLH